MQTNNINKALPGFTLLELLIGMLLSAIVIGITYLYFSQFQLYLMQKTTQSNQHVELGQFNVVFQRDLDQANTVYYHSPDKIQMHKKDYEVEYKFESENIIRNLADSKDTFALKSLHLEVEQLQHYNQLVNLIKFEAGMDNNTQFQFFFTKEYSSKTLFTNHARN